MKMVREGQWVTTQSMSQRHTLKRLVNEEVKEVEMIQRMIGGVTDASHSSMDRPHTCCGVCVCI